MTLLELWNAIINTPITPEIMHMAKDAVELAGCSILALGFFGVGVLYIVGHAGAREALREIFAACFIYLFVVAFANGAPEGVGLAVVTGLTVLGTVVLVGRLVFASRQPVES